MLVVKNMYNTGLKVKYYVIYQKVYFELQDFLFFRHIFQNLLLILVYFPCLFFHKDIIYNICIYKSM